MALLDLVQKSKKQSSLSSQRGQALVEYVLMLVVSVAMVMALGYQVFKPFQSFLKSYMGDYISCLLETGELPSLGNAETQTILEDSSCNAQFQPASLAGGRPPGANSDKTKDPSKNSGSESGSSDGSGSGANGSSSRGGNLLISSMNNKKTATETSGKPEDKVTEIPLAESSQFYNRRNSYSSDAEAKAMKTTALGEARLTEEEKKKQERKDAKQRVVASGENMGPPLKKIAIKNPEAKVQTEIEDTPLTFGNFFRFLLIAAIVIAILVVLGSQALKIAKSQEK